MCGDRPSRKRSSVQEWSRKKMVLLIYQSNTTPFRRVPICDIETSIRVPGTKYFGGFKNEPTPPIDGIDVSTISDTSITKVVRAEHTWCSSHNYATCLELCALAQITDQLLAVEQQIVYSLALPRFSIYYCLQVKL